MIIIIQYNSIFIIIQYNSIFTRFRIFNKTLNGIKQLNLNFTCSVNTVLLKVHMH